MGCRSWRGVGGGTGACGLVGRHHWLSHVGNGGVLPGWQFHIGGASVGELVGHRCHRWWWCIVRVASLGWQLRIRRASTPSNVCNALALMLASAGHQQRHIGGKALEQDISGGAVAGRRICGVSATMPWRIGGSVGVGGALVAMMVLGHCWDVSGCISEGLWRVGIGARHWWGGVVGASAMAS